jgi:peptidoglycan-associated lipoprotein
LLAHPAVRVEIEGHCDDRGTEEYKMALGSKRANAVRTYLVMKGVSVERITTISYGEMKPFALGQTEQDYAQNRRAHFVVSE